VSNDVGGHGRSLEAISAGVVERLRPQCSEIEETIFAHVRDALPDPIGDEDAEYVVGLRAAVTAAVDYGLTGIEHGEGWSGTAPSAAIVQAGRAARGGVGLDTVLLRYMAGYTLLGDLVMDEAERVSSIDGATRRHLRRIQAALLARLTASIAEEYRRELQRTGRTSRQRSVERVQRLLAGEPVDTAELGYELDVWHLGVIGTGAKAESTVRRLAAGLGRELLLVARSDETVWAWFGDPRRLAIADIGRLLLAKGHSGVSLAIGEPGRGVKGFRLTHRQAQAARSVALRRPQWLTRYGDVALLAFALRDEALARSLVDIYLSPLDGPRKGSRVLRQTLRAYFAAERNASSAAAALGVARQTVENRLRRVEKKLGRLLPTCLAELEVALRLEELGGPSPGEEASSSSETRVKV
jgi:diguanylate cyclase with GGDEF domain/PucR-like helix-turn-helix protein